MPIRILLVEDEPKIALAVQAALRAADFDVSHASDGAEGFYLASTERFDLMVLDLGLPGRDGMQVLKAVRSKGCDMPVIIASSLDSVDDRVRGLHGGADDYLVKPYAMAELLARIEALLRRGGNNGQVLKLQLKDLSLDIVTRKVLRAGRPVELTQREFELLEYLMRHARCTVSRAMLARDVWHEIDRATPLDNVIDVHIARLRRKIDLPNREPLIRTVRGVGFCLSDCLADPEGGAKAA